MYNQAGNAEDASHATVSTHEGIKRWVASGQSLRFRVSSSSASASFEEGINQDGVDINIASLNVSKGFKEIVDRATGFHASEGIVSMNRAGRQTLASGEPDLSRRSPGFN